MRLDNTGIVKITFAILLLILIFERLSNTFKKNKQSSEVPTKRFHRHFFLLLLGVYLLIILVATVSFFNANHINIFVSAVGMPILVLGVLLRRASIQILGKYWSPYVEIRRDHQIITDGPFKYLKHPYYTAVMLELIGFSLTCNSLVGVSIAVLIQWPLLMLRICSEEKILKIYRKRYGF